MIKAGCAVRLMDNMGGLAFDTRFRRITHGIRQYSFFSAGENPHTREGLEDSKHCAATWPARGTDIHSAPHLPGTSDSESSESAQNVLGISS